MASNRKRSSGFSENYGVDSIVEKAFRTERGKATLTKRTAEDELQDKKNELTEWIAKRLQESTWYLTTKESFRNKLENLPISQLYGQEKRVMEDLIKSVAPDARNSLPDTIKMDLVKAVQDMLQKDEEILKCFRRDNS